jgi:hypothetical protein
MIPAGKLELLHRLKRASAGEIVYRLRKKLTARKLKSALSQGSAPFAVPTVDPCHIAELEMPRLNIQSGTGLIKRLIGGETFRLNADAAAIQAFEEKHRQVFFDAVKQLPGDPDIRAVWEPARLQHAALLLLCDPPDCEARRAGKEIVLRWIRTNPFLWGPHYMSAMECGLRVPVFFYCLKEAPDLSDEERGALLLAVFGHGWWIEKNLSLYASLGNHTVCECVGLAFAGAVFGRTDEGKRWIGRACGLLAQECRHQILNDGGPAEQSFAYHRFVLDLYTLVIDFLETNKLYDWAGLRERVTVGERFLKAFEGPRGELPSIGDSDDGHAIAPGAAPVRGAARPPEDRVTSFPDTGCTLARGAGGLVLTFDALSVTLSYAGKPILVDPGTYRYNGVPDWRRYFKGTRAHNTVTVDGVDQAVQETGFIWSRPYQSKLLHLKSSPGWVIMRGSHDGYSRLPSPLIHERTVFIEGNSKIVVQDQFQGRGRHDFEINFHLHPEAAVEEADGWFKVVTDGTRAFIRLAEGGEFAVIKGLENPIHGWHSAAYGVKQPSPVLSCRAHRAAKEAGFMTVISLNNPCSIDELKNGYRRIEQQTVHS